MHVQPSKPSPTDNWWFPIRATHQQPVLICKMTRQNHQSPKHDCQTPRLFIWLPFQMVCWRPPLPSVSAGLARKKETCAVSLPHTRNRTLSVENWTTAFASLSPHTTVESMPTRSNTPSCQGYAHHAFFLSVNEQSRRHHANMAASEQCRPQLDFVHLVLQLSTNGNH